MIGRGAEVERLRLALHHGAAGSSSVLTLLGAAGMGKTSLTDWAEAEARRFTPPFRVIRVAGLEAQTDVPLTVAHRLVHQLHTPAMPFQRSAVDAVVGQDAHTQPNPRTLATATLTRLSAAAAAQPLLVVIDDLHWADTSSLAVLDLVLHRLESDRLVVLLASRPPSPLAASASGATVRLPGLMAPQAHSLLLERGVSELEPAVVNVLATQTRGSPLALGELAELLTADQFAGREPLPDPLPLGPEGRATYGSVVRTLPANTRLALLVAALAGSRTRQVMLPAMAALRLRPDDLDPALDHHVLIPQSWGFTDPLLRSACHELSSAHEIRRVHLVLAQIFAEADLQQHARHLAAAAGGVDEPTAASLERAADLDGRRFGSAYAGPLWQLAADLSPYSPNRLRRLVSAAESQLLGADRRSALANVDAVLAAASAPDLLARAIRVKTALLLWTGSTSAELAQMTAAAEQVAASDHGAAAEILLNLAMCAQSLGNTSEALRLAHRGARLLPRLDATRWHAGQAVLGQISMAVTGDAGDPSPTLSQSDVGGLLRQGNPAWPCALAQWLLWSERLPEADTLLRSLIDTATEDSAFAVLPFPLTVAAQVDWWRGDWDHARASISEALTLAQQLRQVGLLGYAHTLDALYAVQRLDHEHAAVALRKADVTVDVTRTLPVALRASWVRGHAALAAGDLEGALSHGARADELRRRLTINSMTTVPYLPDYVEAAIRSRDGRAATLLSELGTFALTNGSAWTRAVWLRCSGLAAPSAWQENFEESLTLTPLGDMPFEYARTLACWGGRLVDEGHEREGWQRLRLADQTFAALGSTLWRRHVADLLGGSRQERVEVDVEAAGATRSDADSPDVSLTDQERKVCLLVADGATNRQAAQALLLTEKTIEYHLHKAMTKTGTRNRAQLARLVGEGRMGSHPTRLAGNARSRD